MTPEITDPKFKAIAEEIRKDPENASFTKRGIDPLFFAGPECRIMIVGQAPGRVAEESGIVWNDRSGDRLRDWMGIDRDTFYNSGKLAIVPMDFYFPGTGKSGDLPPRKDFADKWHPRLLELMPDLKLTILVGSYATKRYLKLKSSASLTQVVKDYRDYLPEFFPLVHPSPRNQIWMKKNPWFDQTVIPDLQKLVAQIMG
ncbi:uracil-DNA glycosylase family protein [uncultured Actinomyces sp.]|uniref:uracil-DNA glycosylase family protein n=1 Tax=uncultured Actinomyces sp. TaxID=249061 RepID=UPI0028EB0E4B|nr:uracil-DNA glycosylase family protein [uncultured Actinomyces sp.]